MIVNTLCIKLVLKSQVKLPKMVYLSIKKRQYVWQNKTRFTTKFIKNYSYRPYQPWASSGEISTGDFLG